jgi:hypothetical protein
MLARHTRVSNRKVVPLPFIILSSLALREVFWELDGV